MNTKRHLLAAMAASMWIGGLVGCAPSPEACDQLCDQALETMEGCMASWGQDWETSGYDGREDYANWCTTFVGEQMELARARWGFPEGDERTGDTCNRQLLSLDGGTCEEYAGSWGVWDEFTDGGASGEH